MTTPINIILLADMIKNKRESAKIGLREATEQIGDISASTLLRVENGNIPDLTTYFKICKWLNVPADYFSKKDTKENTQKKAIALLRADKKLPNHTANMLVEMINLAYGYLERKQTKTI